MAVVFKSLRASYSIAYALVLAIVLTSAAYSAGELDPSFAVSAYGASTTTFGFIPAVETVKAQPDGKILIGGSFTDVDGFAGSGIARFNADGTIDTTFKGPDFYSASGIGMQVLAIAVQSDGKILVGGNFLGGGVAYPGVRRLNPDGSLDASFTNVQIATDSIIYDIEIQSDNKILVGGYNVGIFRLNADGTFDNTFPQSYGGNLNYGVKAIDIAPGGNIIVGGGGSSVGMLERLFPNGAEDQTFISSSISGGQIEDLEVRPDGKILVVGTYSNSGSFARLALLQSNGQQDFSFQNGSGPNDWVNDIEVKPDGKILIAGRFSSYNGVARSRLAQVNADGTLDTVNFNISATTNMNWGNEVAAMPDGKIVFGGRGDSRNAVTRFHPDGSPDTTLAGVVNRTGTVNKVLRQPDGKVLIAGQFRYVNGVARNSLARLNADGSLDTTFVPFFANESAAYNITALALQPNGRIVAGISSLGRIRRLNVDGSNDTEFANVFTANVYDIAVLPNGQIWAGGNSGGLAGFLTKFNSDGTTLSSGQQPDRTINKIIPLADGRVLVGGAFTKFNSTPRVGIALLNASGVPDPNWAPAVSGTVCDMEIQPDGKIVVGGTFTGISGNNTQVNIGRLNADGSVDNSFAQSTNSVVLTVELQPDGKILLGGTFSGIQGVLHNGIGRINSNGSVDATFNTFANTTVNDIELQPDGKILIGGAFTKINDVSAVRIARLTQAPIKSTFDFDGDGKSDLGIFRPSNGTWYLKRSTAGELIQNFGINGDRVAAADYDGDGKTDLAVYRNGDWWYLNSSTGIVALKSWGSATDVPLPSDFDADGKADFIYYRPSPGEWFRSGSAGANSTIQFGMANDIPLIADMDGDGKTDPTVYRPSNGTFWYRSSVNGADTPVQWGQNGDVPVPADYDGDGKTDAAVFRPSNGAWYILNSSNGSFTVTSWGVSGDRPVAADYDGDGRADVSIWRPSTGVWFILQSTAGFAGQQYGISTDTAIPNAYLP